MKHIFTIVMIIVFATGIVLSQAQPLITPPVLKEKKPTLHKKALKTQKASQKRTVSKAKAEQIPPSPPQSPEAKKADPIPQPPPSEINKTESKNTIEKTKEEVKVKVDEVKTEVKDKEKSPKEDAKKKLDQDKS
jgi:outer membrane biosynthesis protein TonB